MRRLKLISALFLWGVLLVSGSRVGAQEAVGAQELDILFSEATESGEATPSAEATGAGTLVERVIEKKPDITEPEGEVKGRLRQILEAQEVGPLNVTNFLQHAIRKAVSQGVPTNTIVLVLLFPLVAAVIAAGRHLIGLRGFGIFTPAVLSVAFVATGTVTGIVLFLVILLGATLMRRVLKGLRLQYLPRMALLLWGVSLGVLGSLFAAPFIRLEALAGIQIFPILILILLAENFIEVQISKSRREATQLTVETVILAIIASLLLSLEIVQRFALLHPEMVVLSVALFNVFVGKYVGLRYTEYLKFKKLM
jgi:hypothetical protein